MHFELETAKQERREVKILDLGSGPGANAWYLAREGFSVSCIDGSATAIEKLKARLSGENLSADAVVGDICTLPWPDNTFDAVVDCECICCNNVEATKKILAEVRRVCKPSGKFLSLTFAPGMQGCDEALRANGHYVDSVTEGPLVGKGGVRITTEDDIAVLYGEYFCVSSIDYASRTNDNRSSVVNEWIICCQKV